MFENRASHEDLFDTEIFQILKSTCELLSYRYLSYELSLCFAASYTDACRYMSLSFYNQDYHTITENFKALLMLLSVLVIFFVLFSVFMKPCFR